jgi:hypothetical protein
MRSVTATVVEKTRYGVKRKIQEAFFEITTSLPNNFLRS